MDATGAGSRPPAAHRAAEPDPMNTQPIDALPPDVRPTDALPAAARPTDALPPDARPTDALPADPPPARGAAAADEPPVAVPVEELAEEWPVPTPVPPEPAPDVVAMPVVVPATSNPRLRVGHPLLAETGRVTSLVRPRRSGEGGATIGRTRPARADHGPRRPLFVLPSLILLALVAAFFAWVSAEPFWLAVGHGDAGTATVTRDRGSGLGQRCLGDFRAAGGAFQVRAVPVTGVAESRCTVGATIPARMVSATGREAYGGTGGGLTARWALGFLLVLACAIAIVRVSGAARFAGRQRAAAVALTFSAPLLIMIGILGATF
jgi:hypothetical protein